jgi:glucose/arabinose dehydrogenase
LNHGLALNGGYLYASSASAVYRWAYNDAHVDLGEPTQVVTGIPAGGNHTSRTLLFDDMYLYVSVGSAANVDPDSSRAQIRRFLIADLGTSRAFGSGELFADGLRNEVGLALDSFGQVWGVENGMDELVDSDLGGDIHNTNPGEELNLFATSGKFYGYPYCWSEFLIPGDAGGGVGEQWWLEGSELPGSDAGTADEWCKDPENVVPPALVFPAHVAPLDIRFYTGNNFPADYLGDALVTFHGSWNTEPPAGYKVVRVQMDESGQPTGDWEPLYQYSGGTDTGGEWNERPVALAVLPDGTVLVTSDDDADRIVAIKYVGISAQSETQNDF